MLLHVAYPPTTDIDCVDPKLFVVFPHLSYSSSDRWCYSISIEAIRVFWFQTASPFHLQTTATGGPCPVGHYCPENSTRPIECPGGSYAKTEAKDECDVCPAGSYCPIGAYNLTDCPVGSFCPSKSPAPIPCDQGTFNNETGVDITTFGFLPFWCKWQSPKQNKLSKNCWFIYF